jgi:predicted phage tail protein
MKETRTDLDGGWRIALEGSGGGGGGGGGGGKGGKGNAGSRAPVEDAESLRSRSEAIIVAVLSEGEVQGFEAGVDPLTRIYLDNVPIKNSDGSFNFEVGSFYTGSPQSASGKGAFVGAIAASTNVNRSSATGTVNSIVADYRTGTQNQASMPGFDDVKVEQGVGIKATVAAGPISRTTANAAFTRLRVRVGVGALFRIDSSTGDVKGTSVEFNIQIRPDGGSAFVNENKTISGKSRGPVDFEYEYALQGAGPWVVTVRRLTADPTTTSITDDLFFKAIVGTIDRSFRYPNTALIGIKIGAENFNSVPQVSADMLGLKIKIPSNYNPLTRQYSGIWDGTFKTEWSDNPVWVFYDLLTNTRYGTGAFITEASVDRYSLYPISQYCDELVPNGRGGLEPRFTFNAYVTDRGEAYEVLNALAASFRGMLYFSEGTIVAIQDRPKSISKIFSPANVIQQTDDNGNITSPPFAYEGTGRRARKTVALVSWNDPDDNYKSKIEYVEDRDGLERYGYHEIEIRAFGTTSQGQAQRIGRWNLLTNQLETETVTFKVATEGFFVLPGEVIGIADPAKGGKRFGGRIASGSTTSAVNLDAPYTILGGSSYSLSIVLPSGAVQTRSVVNGPGASSTLSVIPAFSSAPEAGSAWVLQENASGVRRFRVISVNEDNGEVTVLGSLYEDTKFALVDSSTILAPRRTSVGRNIVVPQVRGGSIILGAPVQ